MRRDRTNSRGFSLVELLIVMALLVTIFVLFYTRGSKSFQQRQKEACLRNLQVISVSLQLYATDFNGHFPFRRDAATSEQVLDLLFPRYTTISQPFICPGTKAKALPEGEWLSRQRISYAYYMGRSAAESNEVLVTDAQVNTGPKIEGEPLFSADGKGPGANHHQYGGNVLFVDGRAETVSRRAPFSILLPPGTVLLNPRP